MHEDGIFFNLSYFLKSLFLVPKNLQISDVERAAELDGLRPNFRVMLFVNQFQKLWRITSNYLQDFVKISR